MKSLRAIANVARPIFAAFMLLVPLAAVEAGETVSDYVETKLTAGDGAAADWFGNAVGDLRGHGGDRR